MEAGAIDVCNFDSSWAGGPTNWRRNAAVAHVYGVELGHHEEPHVARPPARQPAQGHLPRGLPPRSRPDLVEPHPQPARARRRRDGRCPPDPVSAGTTTRLHRQVPRRPVSDHPPSERPSTADWRRMARSRRRTPTTRPGIKEVAERAGVAISSVSRVLSGHPDVSPAMRDAVEQRRARARLPPERPRPRAAQPAQHVGGLRRRRHRQPDLRRHREGRRANTACRRLLAAAHQLRGRRRASTPTTSPCSRIVRSTACCSRSTQEDNPDVGRGTAQRASCRWCCSTATARRRTALSARFDHRVGMREAVEHLLELGHRDCRHDRRRPGAPGPRPARRGRADAVAERRALHGRRGRVRRGGRLPGARCEALDRNPAPDCADRRRQHADGRRDPRPARARRRHRHRHLVRRMRQRR